MKNLFFNLILESKDKDTNFKNNEHLVNLHKKILIAEEKNKHVYKITNILKG